MIEKHFTIDREMEGNDHKVSLLPGEFAEMVARIREVESALGSAAPRAVSTGEMMNRVNLAKSLVAARRIEAGELITADAVDIKSPGRGLQPNAHDRLVGRTAQRALDPGDFFYATDLGDAAPTGRPYSFRRPWGLPVRYHDVAAMTRDCTPGLPGVPLLLQGPRAGPGRGARRPRPAPGRRATPATARTCSPATSCSTWPATTTTTGSGRSRSCSGSST